jgi:hypothetical protein
LGLLKDEDVGVGVFPQGEEIFVGGESSQGADADAARVRATPALVILEDLDRAFPTEGKRTQERTVSFQTLLNCLDGVDRRTA